MIHPTSMPDNPTHGGPCFCCRRRDEGVAFITRPARYNQPAQLLWACIEHIPLARKAHLMPRKELDFFEQEALQDAGAAAGGYLDSIGKTDLAALDQVEWVTFQRIHLDTFGTALAKRLASDEAPF